MKKRRKKKKRGRIRISSVAFSHDQLLGEGDISGRGSTP
jgi:hypothetical protein